jgi:CheY-like chemotaxis protein
MADELILNLRKLAQSISILYVEDDLNIQKQTVDFLSRFYHKIHIANNGQEGFDIYRQTPFDIVISDINMPIMNGINMIKNIKARNPDQIVIVTSAHNEPEYLIPLINLGVDRFLMKPFNRKNFIRVLYHFSKILTQAQENVRFKQELEQHSDQLQQIIQSIDNGILVIEKSEIIHTNSTFLSITNCKDEAQLLEVINENSITFLNLEGYLGAKGINELIQNLMNVIHQKDKVIIKCNGRYLVYLVSLNKLSTERYLLSFLDVTQIDQHEFVDTLTNLPNRSAVKELIRQNIKEEKTLYLSCIRIKHMENLMKVYGKIHINELMPFATKEINTLLLDNEDQPCNLYSFGFNKFIIFCEKKCSIGTLLTELSLEKEYPRIKQEKYRILNCSFMIKEFTFNPQSELDTTIASIETQFEKLI